ncbi:MAG: hypothetical protein LBD93_03615 [Treponema sp.]|nr:hypothetical protein [Treponema sp.]
MIMQLGFTLMAYVCNAIAGIPVFVVFWIKIAVTKIRDCVKQYPGISIGTSLVAFAFVITNVHTIIHLDTKECITVLSVLFFTALSISLKNYTIMPTLIMYSKSSFINETIRALFFIKMSMLNNIPLLLFNLVVLKGLIKVERYI